MTVSAPGSTQATNIQQVISSLPDAKAVEIISKVVMEKLEFWKTITMAQLSFLVLNVLPGIQRDSALALQIQQQMRRSSDIAQTRFQSNLPTISQEDIEAVKKGMIKVPKRETSASVFVQGNMTNEEAIAYIKANAGTLTRIELSNVSNPLLQTIAEECLVLSSFSISLSEATFNVEKINLKLIHAFPPLDELKLNIWNIFYTSPQEISELLNNPRIHDNVKKLSLLTPAIDDAILGKIGSFKKLESLRLAAVAMTPQGVTNMLTALPGLQSLNLIQGPSWGALIDNNVLNAIASCKQLKRLSLFGKWESDDKTLQATLTALSQLTRLDVIGFAPDSETGKVIGEIATLKSLSLADCSKIQQGHYEALLKQIAQLERLSLQKCYQLQDLKLIANQAANLKSLSLFDCGSLITELAILCKSEKLKASLETLTIGNNGYINSPDFIHIRELANLRTLRIIGCITFNDTSINGLWGDANKSKIRNLELNGVSVSGVGLDRVRNIPELEVLMLANMCAVTREKFIEFLGSERLQNSLKKLYIEKFVVDKAIIPLFGNFKAIDVLVIGNPMEMPYDDERLIFEVESLKKRHVSIEEFWGELTTWGQFQAMN